MKAVLLPMLLAVVLHRTSATLDCEKEFRCHDHEMNRLINLQIRAELQAHYTYLFMAQLFDHHDRNYPKVAKYFRAKSAEELSHAERFIQYQNQRGGEVELTGVTIYGGGECASVTTVKQAFRCAMEMEARVTRKLTQLHQDASQLTYVPSNGAAECNVPVIKADDLRLTQPILVTVSKTKGGQHVTETISDYRECACGTDETHCKVVSFSYVELAEMIAHEFLDHQLEDTKEIANHYNTLKKMYGDNDDAALASWLFDQHLEL